MANEQVFDSIVDPSANKQVQALTTDLAALDAQAVDTAKSINILNTATANSKTYADLQKNAAAVESAQTKAQNSLEKTRLAEIRLQQAREKAFDDYEKKALRQQSANAKLSSSYNQLSKELDIARAKAKDIGATFGTSSEQFKAAQVEVLALDGRVKDIDKSLGQSQRNVGNYGNVFQKAFSGIRTLANIIPNFGIGTFFLLLGTSIVSAANAIGLFNTKVSDAQKNLTNLNDVMKNANKEGANQATNLKILYAAATDVTNSYQDRIRAAQELKKEFPGTYKNDSDLAIISGELSAQTRQLTDDIYANAKARAAATKISELAAQQLDIDFQKQKIINQKQADIAKVKPIKTIGGGAAGGVDVLPTFADPATQRKSVTDQQQTLKDLLRGELEQQDLKRKSLQNQIDFLTKFAGGNNKIAKALSSDNTGTEKAKDPKSLLEEQLKAVKLAEDAILQNDKASFEDRQAAIDLFYNKSYDLIKKASDQQVLTQLETNNKLTEIDNDSAKDRLKVQEDARKEIAKILKDGIKDQEDAERASIEVIQKAGDDKILSQQQNAADAILAVSEQYAKGIINEKEYQKQLTEINDQADIDRLDQEIVSAQAIIDVRKGLLAFGIGSAKELQQAEDKLANLQLARTKAVTKAVIDGTKDQAQARQELHAKEKELADDAVGFLKEVVDGGYQKQIEALQKLSDQVDDNANTEKQANNNSLLSAKDKADKNAVIDAKATQQKAVLAEQENKIKRKQAEFDRALSIAAIIENTAVAISKTLAEGGILFSPLVGVIAALGAVQIATVLATPLPSFKDGGLTPGGKVLWGEAGTEMATLPDGSKQISAGPTIQSFPKGTKITPHLELMQMLKPEYIPTRDREEIGWREVVAAIKNQQQPKQRGVKVIVDHRQAEIRKSYFK